MHNGVEITSKPCICCSRIWRNSGLPQMRDYWIKEESINGRYNAGQEELDDSESLG